MKILIFILFTILLNSTFEWGSNSRKEKGEEKDLYKILEIDKKANKDEIKAQYRKLTKKYHPDKKDGNKEKFTEINEAYEILSDNERRRTYDRKGYEAAKNSNSGGGVDDDDDGLFSSFFGGRMKRENKMDDQKIKIRVTLSDLYNGKEYNYKYTRNIICPHCRGTGADSEDDLHICNKCGGEGYIVERRQIGPGFIQQVQKECPKCGGKGKTIKNECHVCSGERIVLNIEEMSVYVEKGMRNGQVITYEDAADESPDKRAGNLVFSIQEIKDKTFERDGNDLKVNMRITLKEALLGFDKFLTHLDGREIDVFRDEVTQPGYVIKLLGEGMPIHNHSGDYGDLYIKIIVEMPKELNEEQLKFANEFFSKRANW